MTGRVRFKRCVVVGVIGAMFAIAGSLAFGQTAPPATVWFQPQVNPPIGSEFVSVQNGHLSLGGQRYVAFGVNFDWWALQYTYIVPGKGTLDPGGQAVLCKQLDNLVTAGVRVIRFHNWDCGTENTLFNIYNLVVGAPPKTTRQLDSQGLAAFDYFVAQCKARNLRIILTLHSVRQLNSADRPPWPCPTFDECVNGRMIAAQGQMDPWMWWDPGLIALQNETSQQILRHVNQFTGVSLGDDPTLLAVILQNERSLAKVGLYYDPVKWPVIYSLMIADLQAWCQVNGINWHGIFSPNKEQLGQYLSWKETQVLSNQAAAVRGMTKGALVIAGTFFGNESYVPLVAINAAGDAVDFHCYSRDALTDPNRLLTGPNSATGRTIWSGIAAGCSWGKPVFCLEYAGVSQATNPKQRDSDSERAQEIAAVVRAAVAQDVDVVCLYSWGHGDLHEGKDGPYDFRNDAATCRGLQSHAAWFHDLTLRPAMVVTVAPTAGVYGMGVPPSYQGFGPLTDPALYAMPANQAVKVLAP